MKILQIIPYFFVHWTGGREGSPVETVYGLSKALAKRGHEVSVYTTDAFNKRSKAEYQGKPSRMQIDGIQVREFRSMGDKLGSKYHIVISLGMVRAMAREVGNFDILHLHEYRTLLNVVAHHYARKYDIPYVLQAHGSLPIMTSQKGLKQIYDNFWGYRLLKDALRVIAVTKREAEQYKKMGVDEDKIEIIPNGIDLSEYENLPKRGEFRKKYGINESEKIILFLARIVKIKGPDLLAKAFAELSKEIDNVNLVIVGPDEGYLPSLKKLIADLEISDKVLFTGPLYGQEKLKAYVDADVYVLPSSYEIFGVAILESLGCGTPVIVTDRCGIADVIDGRAGLVVPYDKDQLRDAVLHMIGNDKLRREFGEKGRLLVRERFNREKIAQQVENVYQSVI